jgi:uncharacterized protein (DUF697 family)
MDMSGDMHEKRRKAEKWVNGYTAVGVAAVVAVAMIPGAATAILCTIEITMCYQIGLIYRSRWTKDEAEAAATAVGLAAVAGKIAALEATILLGCFALIAKPIIAGGIIWALGQLIIRGSNKKSLLREV